MSSPKFDMLCVVHAGLMVNPDIVEPEINAIRLEATCGVGSVEFLVLVGIGSRQPAGIEWPWLTSATTVNPSVNINSNSPPPRREYPCSSRRPLLRSDEVRRKWAIISWMPLIRHVGLG